ncbi:TonB-dependent receptor domain-containing protein [Prevotella sp. HUN102]|uniref:TonB-dependent receptor domain-containing protein n=1 Tax=Prevotella sp. HUN102 TaxID=1392486 RepID=UPI00068F0572
MNKMKAFLLACFAVAATGASAQTTTITGELVDSLTRETEPFATVRVYKNGKSDKPVAMFVTDENGKFSQTVSGQGKYYVSFTSLGRKEIVRRFEVGSASSTLNMGTLLVQDDPKQLEGVEVVAQKPLVKMETDKMTYDVLSDVDSKSNTVLDMLRKVPMVTVDGQDNITVNGQGSFKVYVDGKPNVMFSANPSQIFKAMPASAVKSIEVVTNPGAKYDAEGVGGVLNIVMNKMNSAQAQNMNGYNGNVSATMVNYGIRSSAFLSGQQGKLTYSANGMYSYMESDKVEMMMDRIASDGSTMSTYQKGKTTIPFTMGNVSLGYELDSMSNIGASLGFTSFTMKSTGHPTNSFFGGIYGSGFSYGNEMMMKNLNTSFNGSVDYQRFLNKARTSNITLSYLFTTTPGTTENNRIYDPLPPGITLPLHDLYSEADTRGTEHTFQADYTTPLAKNHTLNAGVKFIGRRNSSDSRYYDIINGLQMYNAANSVDYKNKQSILASYIEYALTAGKFGAKFGTRYEHTWENVEFILGPGSNFKKNYGNVVPSASFTYNIAQSANIGINYGMRISRPGITYLNPYVDRSNATILSYGNPDLAVEKSHNVSLVFNYFTPKFMINMTLGENFANNQIEQYSFMDNGILNTTYGNIVRSRWTNFSTFMNYAITPKTRLMFNGGFDYGDIRSNQLGARNYGWQFEGFIGLQQTLPWDIKWSIFTGGSTKKYNLQGYGDSFNMFTTTFAKSFFKERLDVSVMYFTPLTGKMKLNQVSEGADFTQRTRTIIPVQQIGLTVTWNFGNTKKQFQKHESKISNDFQEKKNDNQIGGMGVGVGM